MVNMRLRSILMSGLRPGPLSSKRVIASFAEEHGLVYFGYVSQRNDDHHIVRGMTVSTKHRDDHYCIGTYDGYDIVFVERTDALRDKKKHSWHIMEFDLKSKHDMPHGFIGSQKRGNGFHELLSVKYPSMQPMRPGVTAAYPNEFLNHFSLYCTPAHAVELETIITPEIAAMIGAHFGGLVMEINNDSLFVYSESSHLTTPLLATMAKNGVWLAEQIDKNNRPH